MRSVFPGQWKWSNSCSCCRSCARPRARAPSHYSHAHAHAHAHGGDSHNRHSCLHCYDDALISSASPWCVLSLMILIIISLVFAWILEAPPPPPPPPNSNSHSNSLQLLDNQGTSSHSFDGRNPLTLWSTSSSSSLSASSSVLLALNDDLLSVPKGLDPQLVKLLVEARAPLVGVPKIVHFVWGLGSSHDASRFLLTHLLSIKSARDVLGASHIYFHYNIEPSGEWWNRAREWVIMMPARKIHHIFGRNIEKFAHKADVIRLEALLQYGGIYMDVDVVAIKSFDSLLQYDCVLGYEKKTDSPHPHGLGNGVIVARKGAHFIREWYSAYRHFDLNKWASLSVHFPLELSASMPASVKRLPYDAFYTPVWDSKGMAALYEADDYDLTPNFAVHLWASSRDRLHSINDLCNLKSTLGRIARIAWLANNKDGCNLSINSTLLTRK